MLFDYDNSDPRSILEYAKNMIDKTFNDLLNEYNKSKYKTYEQARKAKNGDFFIREEEVVYAAKPSAKGELGNFIEKYYFGYLPNGDQEADFKEAHVELKQTPIDILKNGKYSAGERLVITMISFKDPVVEDFFDSHLWEKIQLILLIHYIRDKSLNRLDYPIKYVNLFTPPSDDLKIIMEDYRLINEKIKAGKAHELSEGDTMYLGACTKGATALKSLVPQYYGNHSLAKKRSFCFKRSYMDYILKQYVMPDKLDVEKIIKNADDLQCKGFEEIIISKIEQYYGNSDVELMDLFAVKQNKTQWATIIYRILGIHGNSAEEFVKANIKIKAIRVEENGTVREHMPLPTFRFREVIRQEWEESNLYKLISETKYLFVLFYKRDDNYILKKALFWNMSETDIETAGKEWNLVKNTIIEGVKFTRTASGIIKNNLLGSSESQIIHVRPHTSKSAYKLNDGYTRGDLKHADQLPDGQYMTQQSFWINKEYLIEQFIKKV